MLHDLAVSQNKVCFAEDCFQVDLLELQGRGNYVGCVHGPV